MLVRSPYHAGIDGTAESCRRELRRVEIGISQSAVLLSLETDERTCDSAIGIHVYGQLLPVYGGLGVVHKDIRSGQSGEQFHPISESEGVLYVHMGFSEGELQIGPDIYLSVRQVVSRCLRAFLK